MTIKLYDVPRKSRLVVDTDQGKKTAVFHRIDGMYSLCVLDGDSPERERIFHLKAWTEVVKVGDHYEVASSEN